jgi:hypothetical protein
VTKAYKLAEQAADAALARHKAYGADRDTLIRAALPVAEARIAVEEMIGRAFNAIESTIGLSARVDALADILCGISESELTRLTPQGFRDFSEADAIRRANDAILRNINGS